MWLLVVLDHFNVYKRKTDKTKKRLTIPFMFTTGRFYSC